MQMTPHPQKTITVQMKRSSKGRGSHRKSNPKTPHPHKRRTEPRRMRRQGLK
jgi:hypothetical protein